MGGDRFWVGEVDSSILDTDWTGILGRRFQRFQALFPSVRWLGLEEVQQLSENVRAMAHTVLSAKGTLEKGLLLDVPGTRGGRDATTCNCLQCHSG